MDSDIYDALDRRLAAALQLDGRASFAAIGDALGVSEKTIARRYARFRAGGGLRVAGRTNPYRLGEQDWVLRLRCRPEGALKVAEALARRPDTSWISLASGGTEVLCSARASAAAGVDALVLRTLPRSPQVLDISAHGVLHVFFGGAVSAITKAGLLTPEQVRALVPAAAPAMTHPIADEPGAAVVRLDAADRAMLRLLAADGRAPYPQLAQAAGVSASTARRRVAELRARGALYFDLDMDIRLITRQVRCTMWLTVAPAHLDAVGRALAGHPEVAFAAATTGRSSVHAALLCRDMPALYAYLTTRVAALEGVTGVETAPTIRIVKSLSVI